MITHAREIARADQLREPAIVYAIARHISAA
jgi:hypothetical protein